MSLGSFRDFIRFQFLLLLFDDRLDLGSLNLFSLALIGVFISLLLVLYRFFFILVRFALLFGLFLLSNWFLFPNCSQFTMSCSHLFFFFRLLFWLFLISLFGLTQLNLFRFEFLSLLCHFIVFTVRFLLLL